MSMKWSKMKYLQNFSAQGKKKKKRQNRREQSHKVITERRQIGILTLIQRKVGPDHSLGKK